MNLTSFCSTDMPLYDQVNNLLHVVEIVLQLSTKESSNGTKSGNNLYPKVIKCVGVTLDSALRRNHITSLYRSVIICNTS